MTDSSLATISYEEQDRQVSWRGVSMESGDEFDTFMANDVATVERIYEAADLPMTNEARAQIAAYHESHPRGKDGQVVYDLRTDFGVEPSAVRAAFDFYLERFDVRIEAK